MAEGIRYGFKIGDRWPVCKDCGKVFLTAYRKGEDRRWRNKFGDLFDPEEKCNKCEVGRLRLAIVHYADELEFLDPFTLRWAGDHYVMVKTTVQKITPTTSRLYVFFNEVGGTSKPEALYWAKRAASKNGFPLVLPPAFEGVEAKLPEKS